MYSYNSSIMFVSSYFKYFCAVVTIARQISFEHSRTYLFASNIRYVDLDHRCGITFSKFIYDSGTRICAHFTLLSAHTGGPDRFGIFISFFQFIIVILGSQIWWSFNRNAASVRSSHTPLFVNLKTIWSWADFKST